MQLDLRDLQVIQGPRVHEVIKVLLVPPDLQDHKAHKGRRGLVVLRGPKVIRVIRALRVTKVIPATKVSRVKPDRQARQVIKGPPGPKATPAPRGSWAPLEPLSKTRP
jgi:hypothetical protein